MIRHHTIQSKWTDEGHRATISLPCEPWSQGEAQQGKAEQKGPVSWSEADVQVLKDLVGQGLSQAQIAQKMGRSKPSIEGKLRRMKNV
jgi:DNA-binding NarL/FixJ family response regulator